MGKLWSRFSKGHDNDGNNDDSSLSESDDSTEDEYDIKKDEKGKNDSETSNRRSRKVNKKEPTDGWEEICGIDVDVLEDVMETKKHKITHSNKYISVKDIKVPTVEENRERLTSAYNLWLKYRHSDCPVFMPKWEGILEKPILEQSVLVDQYVKKVFYLLKLEEVPEYDIPDDINKEEVFIRDPNRPGTFITLKDALEKRKLPRRKNNTDICKEIFLNIPSSSRFKEDDSKANLKLLNRNYSHHTV